jgi:hypothetical protein
MIFSTSKKNLFLKAAKEYKKRRFEEKKVILYELEKELMIASTILEHMRKTNHKVFIPKYEEKIKEIKEKINERIFKDL